MTSICHWSKWDTVKKSCKTHFNFSVHNQDISQDFCQFLHDNQYRLQHCWVEEIQKLAINLSTQLKHFKTNCLDRTDQESCKRDWVTDLSQSFKESENFFHYWCVIKSESIVILECDCILCEW